MKRYTYVVTRTEKHGGDTLIYVGGSRGTALDLVDRNPPTDRVWFRATRWHGGSEDPDYQYEGTFTPAEA